MVKIISKRDAFNSSLALFLTVGVIDKHGNRLGILYRNGNEQAPVDLTVQGEGDSFEAVALTEDGQVFLDMCPLQLQRGAARLPRFCLRSTLAYILLIARCHAKLAASFRLPSNHVGDL